MHSGKRTASVKEQNTLIFPHASQKEKKAEKAILALYFLFFALWCAGLVFGLLPQDEQPFFWGMPLWFGISCTIGYGVTCLALAWVVRRFF